MMDKLLGDDRRFLERIRKQPKSELAWAYRLGRKTAMLDIGESMRLIDTPEYRNEPASEVLEIQ